MLIISFVAFTFVEFRWFTGYEVLIPIAIISYDQHGGLMPSFKYKNILYLISFLIIALFNVRTLLNLIH